MKTATTKWFTRIAVVALSMSTVLAAHSPTWARSPRRQAPVQIGMCAPWAPCEETGFVPRQPRHRTDDPYYDRDYDDRQDYDDEYELPYGSYDPYGRTITIPVPTPDLPRGTEKMIEGMLELFLDN